jgi:hypothetical protein
MARKIRKPTDTVQLKLRLSEVLRRRLVREARMRKSSLNTTILALLEEGVAGWPKGQVDVNAVLARTLLNSLNDAILKKIVEIVQKDWAATDHEA